MFLFQDGMFEHLNCICKCFGVLVAFFFFSSIFKNLHLYLLWERGKEWVGTRLSFNLKLFGSLCSLSREGSRLHKLASGFSSF